MIAPGFWSHEFRLAEPNALASIKWRRIVRLHLLWRWSAKKNKNGGGTLVQPLLLTLLVNPDIGVSEHDALTPSSVSQDLGVQLGKA